MSGYPPAIPARGPSGCPSSSAARRARLPRFPARSLGRVWWRSHHGCIDAERARLAIATMGPRPRFAQRTAGRAAADTDIDVRRRRALFPQTPPTVATHIEVRSYGVGDPFVRRRLPFAHAPTLRDRRSRSVVLSGDARRRAGEGPPSTTSRSPHHARRPVAVDAFTATRQGAFLIVDAPPGHRSPAGDRQRDYDGGAEGARRSG